MRFLLGLLLLVSCSHESPRFERPSWVSAVRSGEESLRVSHGKKIFFRRIAGGPSVSRQVACDLVVMKAQEDIRSEFQTTGVPHTIEVLFYDVEHRDCAVTISVDPTARSVASVSPKSADELAEEELSRLLVERSEKAMRFALTGLTRDEFEKYSNEKVTINTGEGLCQTFFRTQEFSVHGLTQVCWMNNNIQGYCTSRTKQCWVRTAN